MYDVNIDFDQASKMWRNNKISIGNGSYKYICSALCKTGKKCRNKPLKNKQVCHIHNKKNRKIKI